MSKRPAILELRDSLRRTIATAQKPLTRDEIERLIDERLDQRLRDMKLTFVPPPRRRGCG